MIRKSFSACFVSMLIDTRKEGKVSYGRWTRLNLLMSLSESLCEKKRRKVKTTRQKSSQSSHSPFSTSQYMIIFSVCDCPLTVVHNYCTKRIFLTLLSVKSKPVLILLSMSMSWSRSVLYAQSQGSTISSTVVWLQVFVPTKQEHI